MASVATSNITRLDRTITGGNGTALTTANGAVPVAFYRIASGQAPGDTAVLPKTPEMAAVVSVRAHPERHGGHAGHGDAGRQWHHGDDLGRGHHDHRHAGHQLGLSRPT